ncbi:MAG: mannose-1-phosphate guanylyltransferase [Spirochaetales bacterium]|nr:mannose-1-phosphate guanylyltransferase [Spirochaetales bacterium]
MIDNVLILAGGSGTRLWPVSSSRRPKQYITINRKGSRKSLLELTLDRAAALSARRIMVITLKSQASLVEEAMSAWKAGFSGRLPELYILPEPQARNTAPAITAGVSYFSSVFGDGVNLVLPSDHLISPFEAFAEDCERASVLAEAGRIVTFGIKPRNPETGYGYIESGQAYKSGYEVERFCEKPDLETARRFVDEGIFYWNSGMFVFSSSVYLKELETCAPDVHRVFAPVYSNERGRETGDGIFRVLDDGDTAALYEQSPSISVDYAVMERTEKAAMVDATCEWNDIGSWDEFARLFPEGAGDSWEIDGSGNYVYSDVPVALVGVEDLVVAVQDGKVLICRKGSSQAVKSVIDSLKQDGRKDLL